MKNTQKSGRTAKITPAVKSSHKATVIKEKEKIVKKKATAPVKKSVKQVVSKKKVAPKAHPVREAALEVNVKQAIKEAGPKFSEKAFKVYYEKQLSKPKGERDWSNSWGITGKVRAALAYHFGLRTQRA
jgi:outer membrane biosynthesis protein TonB